MTENISYLDNCIARDVVSGLEICAVRVVYFQLVDSVGKVEKAHSDRNESNAWEKRGTTIFNFVKCAPDSFDTDPIRVSVPQDYHRISIFPLVAFKTPAIQCCGSPGSRVKKDSRIPDPNPYTHRRIKLSILTQKIISTLSKIWSGMFVPDTDLGFLSIPNPGVKKELDPVSGFATLLHKKFIFLLSTYLVSVH